jgi:hypothetical protein
MGNGFGFGGGAVGGPLEPTLFTPSFAYLERLRLSTPRTYGKI